MWEGNPFQISPPHPRKREVLPLNLPPSSRGKNEREELVAFRR